MEEAGAAFTASLASLVYGGDDDDSRNGSERPRLGLCAYLNASVCHPTVEMSNLGHAMTVVAYNPLAWPRTEGLRVPVNTSYSSKWTVTGGRCCRCSGSAHKWLRDAAAAALHLLPAHVLHHVHPTAAILRCDMHMLHV